MDKRNLIWILVLFLIAIPMVSAVTDTDIWNSNLDYYYQFEVGTQFNNSVTSNFSTITNNSVSFVTNSSTTGQGISINNLGDNFQFGKQLVNKTTSTVIFLGSGMSGGAASNCVYSSDTDDGSNYPCWGWSNAPTLPMRHWLSSPATYPTGVTANKGFTRSCYAYVDDGKRTRMYIRRNASTVITLDKDTALDGTALFQGTPKFGSDGNNPTGTFDEFMVFSHNLTKQEVNYTCQQLTRGLHITTGAVAPVITSVRNISITTSTANITWTTNIASNTSVNYGTSKALGTKSQIHNAVTAHNIKLSSLNAATKYYYNVTSCAANLCSVKGVNNFTTSISAKNLTIVALSPANLTQFNTNPIVYRANITTNMTIVNCSLTVNKVVRGNQLLYSPSNKINWSISYTQGMYNWTISCREATTSYRVNSTKRVFYFDSVNPTVVHNFINRSVYYKSGSNMTAKVNFSDTNLFSYNISIDGKQKYGASGLTTTFVQINMSLSPSLYSSLIPHNMTFRVADGHTANKLIDSYRLNPANNVLDIAATQYGEIAIIPVFSKDSTIGEIINYVIPVEQIFPSQKSNLQHISIKPITNSKKDSFTIIPEVDRYSFTYIPENPSTKHRFEVTSDTEIFIVNKPETIYKTWIVTGDKWIDFLLENEPNEKIIIEKTGTYTATVTISGLKNNNKLVFRSIGEFNIVTKKSQFFTFANNPVSYVAAEKEITLLPVSLRVNKTGSLSATTRLIYNGVAYSTGFAHINTSTYEKWNRSIVTPITNHVHTFNASWNYSVSSDVQTKSRVVPFNQAISPFNLTNCTGGARKPGINFTVVDIDTDAPVYGITSNGMYSIWTDPSLSPISGNVVKNFSAKSITNASDNVFNICINTNRTIYIGWLMTYQSSSVEYTTGQSIVQSVIGDVSPQNISNRTSKIFSLPLTPTASSVVINVIDRFGIDLKGHYVKMWLIRPGFPDTLTTAFITDYKGEWQVPYTSARTYRFDVYNVAKTQIIFSTGNTQITSNPLVIQVPNSENDLKSLQSMTGLNASIRCVEATKTCTMRWNDPIIRTAFFEVYRVNGWGSNRIYNASTTAATGTLAYTVVENVSENSYHAQGFVNTNTNNSLYAITPDDLLAGSGIFSNLGDLATVIFVGFFVMLTLAMLLIDLGPVGLTIGMILGLIAGSVLGIVPITIAGIIAIAIVLIIGLYYGRG